MKRLIQFLGHERINEISFIDHIKLRILDLKGIFMSLEENR